MYLLLTRQFDKMKFDINIPQLDNILMMRVAQLFSNNLKIK